jgi:spermidine synthase
MKAFRRSFPYVVVFITSMGIMIIELVASRLVSKHFGTSLYTWTGVIGVVLGGISLGNYIGGKLADRFQPQRIISLLLLTASFLSFLILILDLVLSAFLANLEFSIVTSAVVVRSFVVIVILFFLPSASLGTISPVMAKFALQESEKVGHTVGSIYAISAVGSIIGTFLAGYFLIPLLGIKTIIFLVGATIAVLAIVMGGYRILTSLWVCLIGALYLSGSYAGFSAEHVLYAKDTQYSHMKVKEIYRNERTQRILVMDGLVHNMYDPAAPDDLLYEYEKIFSSLTEYYVRHRNQSSSLRTLTLGGGACVYPTYLGRNYPGSFNEVVEIDPEVIRIAQDYFDAPCDLKVIIADARNYVSAVAKKNQYDIVFLDAFNSFSVPYHLTTEEFTQDTASLLAPDGIFMANCVDILSVGKFLSAYVNTVQEIFPYVCVFTPADTSFNQRSTFVVAASRKPVELDVLIDERYTVIARRLSTEIMRDLKSRNGAVRLTDDYAPVENFMAPVFLESVD